tara:strand:+ start:38 stop:505 length:468 start_codon:yes stop_codon:yes gene_type:complete
MAANQLDITDKKILRILQDNGRITNLQLSQEIGLSPAPTLERVRKLEKAGYIESYHARVNPKMLNLGLQVIIQVSLTRQIENAMQKFIDQINTIDEVVECYQLTGDFDYILKVMVEDIQELDKLVNSKLSHIEEIGQMRSSVILSEIKNAGKLPI